MKNLLYTFMLYTINVTPPNPPWPANVDYFVFYRITIAKWRTNTYNNAENQPTWQDTPSFFGDTFDTSKWVVKKDKYYKLDRTNNIAKRFSISMKVNKKFKIEDVDPDRGILKGWDTYIIFSAFGN